MTNKQIYRKTLGFSVRRLLWDIIAFMILSGASAAGFLIADKTMDKGLIGLVIGAIIGIIILVIWLRFVGYQYKAGQIAMMTRAVTQGSLPDDVIGEGKKIVKSRFATVAAYYAATRIIKGIFEQIGKGITALGNAIGGKEGGAIGSAVSGAVQTIVAYLCDCCLGWVFYRSDIGAGKATCEGAVLFFRHGKTFAKNMGRVFGMGLASFVVIGGCFTGIFYVIFSQFPASFESLCREITEAAARLEAELPQFLTNPTTFVIACAVFAAIILWSLLHETFVRPFILVGVLRNYLESGMDDVPSENAFLQLDSKSEKFRKLHQGLA